jgi:HSP20 family protein
MSLALLIRRHPSRLALRGADWSLDDVFNQIVKPAPSVVRYARRFSPVIDAIETESAYEVTAELPGVDAADLEVEIEDGVLSLRGERKLDAAEGEGEEARSLGRFERRVRLGGPIDEEAVTARHRNGVLRVRVPKQVPPAPESRSVPIEVA